MDEQLNTLMGARGRGIAQADHGGVAIVDFTDARKIYKITHARKIDSETVAAGLKRLAEMPAETVPEPSPLPQNSCLAFPQNKLFVGRQGDLKQLANILKGGNNAAIGQVASATGMGGIGKTQLASEFVHRYGQYFAGGVFWLNFADPASVPAEVANCCYPEESHFELEAQIKYVLSDWQSQLPRLLVFDNCEDEALFEQWCPKIGASRVLLTSRKQQWPEHLGVEKLPIGVLARHESIELLLKLAKHLTNEQAEKIADALADLPLALHLAGSFLHRYKDVVSAQTYLEDLKSESLIEQEALKGRGTDQLPTKHEVCVAKTFAISYDRLNPQDPIDVIGLSLLARAASLAPGIPVPRELLLKTVGKDENKIDPLDIPDGLNRLMNLGLIEIDQEENLVMHRLLGAYVQQTPCIDAQAQRDVETSLLDEANRINDSELPAGLLAWQGHLRFITDRAMTRQDETGADLCHSLGDHLSLIGDYQAARHYFEKALAADQQSFEPGHPSIATSQSNLALVLLDLGELEEARDLLRQALAAAQQSFEPGHPRIATSQSNLAMVLQDLGELEEARDLLRQALAADQQSFEPGHPSIATSQSNLAMVLKDLGELEEARDLIQSAYNTFLEKFGEKHPYTAITKRHLDSMNGGL